MTSQGEDQAGLVQAILKQLSSTERAQAVVYLALTPVAAGTKLVIHHLSIDVPWKAALVFIDQEPTANWSHACRYLLFNPITEAICTYAAQIPPFHSAYSDRWQAIYRAPAVPDWAITTLF
jgi:hypothetical protein